MEDQQAPEQTPKPGGNRELLLLAIPLIISSGFITLQMIIDRVMLTWLSADAVAASMPAALLFWTPFALVQNTANYATTFVAQYLGAGRARRIGPAVWQGLYFSVIAGVAFLGFLPSAQPLIELGGHSYQVQLLEVTYFQCLCFAAFPSLIVATVSSFFAGRGDTWTVVGINAVGFGVNALLDYAWIFGNWGFPAWGVAGAGWATVTGAYASALLALVLLFRPRFRLEFATISGWRFEPELFRRLMWFGLPSGMQWFLDGLAFTMFIMLIGRLGSAELAATSIAVTLNMLAFLPTMGIAQAVMILVGQRLGQDRPDLAEKSTWSGFRLGWLFMSAVAMLYVLTPDLLLMFFRNPGMEPLEVVVTNTVGFMTGPAGGLGAAAVLVPEKVEVLQWLAVAQIVPLLLRFVAVYCLFDSMTLIFSFALRGAGDTRFVTAVALTLSWPMMVIPTWACYEYGWGLYWAWAFASGYIIALAFIFLWRFRQGQWKSMRVIESAPSLPESTEVETAIMSGLP
jgi:MATE family multidrug resistance protein